MPNSVSSERQLLDSLLETLRGLPEMHANLSEIVQSGDRNRRYDAQIDLRRGRKVTTLLINVKKSLYPRDIRQVLWRNQELTGGTPQSVFLLAAESISPGAKDLLREKRVGYFDSGGSLFIFTANIYVFVDKPPSKSMSKSIYSLFSDRRAQVLQVVLMRKEEWFSVKNLAEQAKVSSATASQVLTELEKFDWVATRGQGPSKRRQLREPSALLDTWVKQLTVMQPPKIRRFFVPSVRAEELVKKIADVCAETKAEYAISHEAAGQWYAPFLSTISQVRCRMLAGQVTDETLSTLDARSVVQGANLAIIEVKSSEELLLRQLINRTWLANPVQVYLDLMQSEGRAKELAMHLRNETLGI